VGDRRVWAVGLGVSVVVALFLAYRHLKPPSLPIPPATDPRPIFIDDPA
jgi:hypothetical protein